MRGSRVCVSVVALLGFFIGGCEEKIKPSILPTVDSRTLPSQESWNSNITISDSGRVRAVIYAGYLRVFDDQRLTFMSEGVVVHFYNQQGEQTSIMRSQEGTVDELSNDLEASGNVVVTSSDNTILKTQKLYWDNKQQLIHTPEFVWVTSQKERLEGHGFESDQNLRNYRVFRVTGQATAE